MKQALTLILLFFCTTSIVAQHQKREKIKALKVAHITNELNLSSSEAEKFWPIYNESQDKIQQLRQQSRELHKSLKEDFEGISEKEAVDILNKSITFQNKMHQEKNVLIKRLQQIISAKKIIQLKKAEEDFNRTLLKKFKNRMRNQPPHRGE